MRFASIQGYTALKKHLLSMATSRQIPHAQLFWGPEGNAGLPLALAFITYVQCQHQSDEDSCGQCMSCLKMQQLVLPDVKFVFPVCATRQIPAKEAISTRFLKTWRNFYQENPYGNASDWHCHLGSSQKPLNIFKEEVKDIIHAVSFKAFEGKYKAVLIWLPEYLHIAAANALLKIVEEPPPQTLFILVSTAPDKLLDTMRSRSQHIHVPAFTDEALGNMLLQQHNLPQAQLDQIVLLAAGNLNKALKLAAHTPQVYFEQFKNWMRWCYDHAWKPLLDQAVSFQEMGQNEQKNFLQYTLHMLRAAVVHYFTQEAPTRSTAEEHAFLQKFRKVLTHEQLQTWITWVNQTYRGIERHGNPKMLYIDLSIKIALAFKSLHVNDPYGLVHSQPNATSSGYGLQSNEATGYTVT